MGTGTMDHLTDRQLVELLYHEPDDKSPTDNGNAECSPELAHLNQCAACSDKLLQFRQVAHRLDTFVAPPTPLELDRSRYPQPSSEDGPQPPVSVKPRANRLWTLPLSSFYRFAASLLLCAAIGFAIGSYVQTRSISQAIQTQIEQEVQTQVANRLDSINQDLLATIQAKIDNELGPQLARRQAEFTQVHLAERQDIYSRFSQLVADYANLERSVQELAINAAHELEITKNHVGLTQRELALLAEQFNLYSIPNSL